MAGNPSSAGRLPPLSIGNVVSAGFRLYSAHLKTYLKLALVAYLWLFVPVYGWAKYFAITALISRLAFNELIHQPESLDAARQKVNQQLWGYLGLMLLVLLILMGFYFVILLVAMLVGVLAGIVLVPILSVISVGEVGSAIGVTLATILGGLIFLGGFSWLIARLLIVEVPLATEEDITVSQSLARSWELSQIAVWRIQGIVLVSFLVTLPILVLTNYVPSFALVGVQDNPTLYWTLYPFALILSLAGGVLVQPFWQALKAVLYYDLRSRREGFDLRLRDRPDRG
jgi:hypothetical protein